MQTILLIGLNHETANIDIREKLSFSKDETAIILKTIKKDPVINEIILISTCNRTEVLVTTEDNAAAVKIIKNIISEFKNIPICQFEKSLYIYISDEAIRHIFRVASSLDSMIVGEPQIFGQIKEAYRLATNNKTSGVILNKLLHKTFFVAKRVRSETQIGNNAVSISYAAVELAKKIFGSLLDKQVLLIGAGEMAELAVERLIHNKVKQIFVANRTFKNGLILADRFKGKAINFKEITEYLKVVDIIISSTSSPDLIIKHDQIKNIMRSRKNRPLFFIDIALPRDIDPQINNINNVYVYDIDDLNGVIEENIKDRNNEALKAERIIDEALIRFRKWYESLDVMPTIVDLRNRMNEIKNFEINKTQNLLKHLTEDDYQAIDRMTNAIINKILHGPIVSLKKNSDHIQKSFYIDQIRKIFNLDN